MSFVRRTPLLGLAGLALALVFEAAPARAQAPPPRPGCDACHGELELLRQHSPTLDRARELLAPANALAASAHGGMTCNDCHAGFSGYPHDAAPTQTKSCASCHAEADTAFRAGAHAHTREGDKVRCTSCHGTHDVLPVEALETTAGIKRTNARCVGCHAQGERFEPGTPHADSVSCASCHGPHDIRHADAPGSRLEPTAQARTCGACHEQIAATWLRDDVHAEALRTGRTELASKLGHAPPACTDCHGAHVMPQPSDTALLPAASARCAACHEHYGDAYADSYHGQASHLGGMKAAACADCHDAHSIRPSRDPRSAVAPANRTATCRRCHETANASFTKYDAHVDPHDSGNPVIYWSYKLMNLLLLGTLSFFGLHTVLWLIRLRFERRSVQKGHGE